MTPPVAPCSPCALPLHLCFRVSCLCVHAALGRVGKLSYAVPAVAGLVVLDCGDTVSTPYGDGVVLSQRDDDGMTVVKLQWGAVAFVANDSVSLLLRADEVSFPGAVCCGVRAPAFICVRVVLWCRRRPLASWTLRSHCGLLRWTVIGTNCWQQQRLVWLAPAAPSLCSARCPAGRTWLESG